MSTGIGIGIAIGLSLFIGYIIGYINTIQKTVKFMTFYQDSTIKAVADTYENGNELQAIAKIAYMMKNTPSTNISENLKQEKK